MKKVFSLLFFLLLPIAPLRAQGLNGRVLLLQDSMGNASNLHIALRQNYGGDVDSEYSMPPYLSNYDAILIERYGRLDSVSELRLINYIRGGGKLYFEGNELALENEANGGDTLIRYLGAISAAAEDIFIRFRAVHGVDSEFTRGIDSEWTNSDPTRWDNPDAFYLEGSLIPVLYAQEDFSNDDPIAWIPADTSIHAVIYWTVKPVKYDEFLQRVLCDYFGLCTDAVQEQKPASPSDLRVVEDGDETWLVVSGQVEGELEIVNSLGETVFHCMLSAGGEKIAVPANLPSEVYFARLRGNGVSEMRPFSFVKK